MRKKHGPVASPIGSDQELTHNPGMCPDRESNWRPSALWDSVQPTEPHQSGLPIFQLGYLSLSKEFFTYPRYNSLPCVWFADTFSLLWVVFSGFWWYPLKHKCVWFWWSPFYLLFLLSLVLLVSYLRNHHLTQSHKDLPLRFFPKSSTVRSLIHFELIFLYGFTSFWLLSAFPDCE